MVAIVVVNGEMVENGRIEYLSDVRIKMIETNQIGNGGCSGMMIVGDWKRWIIIDVDDGVMNEMGERVEEVGDE